MPLARVYTAGPEVPLLQLPSMLHKDRKGLIPSPDQTYPSLVKELLQHVTGASFPKCCAKTLR